MSSFIRVVMFMVSLCSNRALAKIPLRLGNMLCLGPPVATPGRISETFLGVEEEEALDWERERN